MRSRSGFRLQRTNDDDDGAAAGCPLPSGARGTAECHRWQKAFCDLGGKCGGLEQCECIEQSSSIECLSDAEATRCADVLESATCTDTGSLVGCQLAEMANAAPAAAGCQLYLTRVCEANERCGGDPAATCAQELMGTGAGQLDCTRAIGLKLSFEKCIEELGTLPCTAEDLPTSCKGALVAK